MTRRTLIGAVVLLTVAMLAGCGGSDDKSHHAGEAAEHATKGTLEMTAAFETKLAGADRLDGTEDHVVAKCPGCALAMDGSDAHAVEVGDYSLHFCSAGCKEHFAEDLEGSLMALAVPQAEPADVEEQ